MSGDLAGASAVEVLFGIVGALLGGVIVFGALLGIGMFLIRMMRQSILGNSLQVEYSNFAWLRDWANVIAADLDLPHVEIFITQNPVMNAYAFGFAKPYCIVLHSGSIRYLSEDELKVIVLHEMAHIKYAHTLALVYLQPFLTLPVVGIFTGWIAGFWQRRTELTADRLALMYIEDAELVKRSLIKIHVGPDVAAAMNQTARDWLQYTAERPMNRFAQTFSSHPFLVRRLSHIDRYAGQLQSVTPPTAVLSVD
jgi:Zn-dependent protease with chaperone function